MECTSENEKIKFIICPPIEFLYAIFNVALEEELKREYGELRIVLNEKINSKIELMKLKTSKFLKLELDYFFDLDKEVFGGIGHIIFQRTAIKNYNVTDIMEFIHILQKEDSVELLSTVVKLILQENINKQINEICDWQNVKLSTDEMIKLVSQLEMKNNKYRDKVIESLENPNETRDRFCLVLKQFYEKAYIQFEDEIINTLQKYKSEYEKNYYKNPGKFTTHYLKLNLNKVSMINLVHISYFAYVLCDSWAMSGIKYVFNVIGAFVDEFYREDQEKEKSLLLFKALSDKKRLDIIELLSDKDWYVYELAEKLDMSAATISYHLSIFQDLDIVQYERYEHRIYYSLDKKKLKELTNKAIDIFLNEAK